MVASINFPNIISLMGLTFFLILSQKENKEAGKYYSEDILGGERRRRSKQMALGMDGFPIQRTFCGGTTDLILEWSRTPLSGPQSM